MTDRWAHYTDADRAIAMANDLRALDTGECETNPALQSLFDEYVAWIIDHCSIEVGVRTLRTWLHDYHLAVCPTPNFMSKLYMAYGERVNEDKTPIEGYAPSVDDVKRTLTEFIIAELDELRHRPSPPLDK